MQLEFPATNIPSVNAGQPTADPFPNYQPDRVLNMWESAGAADTEDAVKVTDDDTTWYILPASNEAYVYLIIPAEIATTPLRRAARLPSHQDSHASSSDDDDDDRCAL